jgi:hypothetical protein
MGQVIQVDFRKAAPATAKRTSETQHGQSSAFWQGAGVRFDVAHATPTLALLDERAVWEWRREQLQNSPVGNMLAARFAAARQAAHEKALADEATAQRPWSIRKFLAAVLAA